MGEAPFSLEAYKKALDIDDVMEKKDIPPTNVIQ